MGKWAYDLLMSNVLEVDARRRVTLGPTATAERYIMDQDPSGVITLTPAVVISEDELKLLGRPDILAAVEKSRADELAGRPRGERPVRRRSAA